MMERGGAPPTAHPIETADGTIAIDCVIDLEQTSESLHAYVEIDGIDIGPGDEVTLETAPQMVPFGERARVMGRARIRKAGRLGRLRAVLEGYLELTELYEVSFSQGRAA